MRDLSDKKIIKSWRKNAQPWVQAIQQGTIKSRVQITNKAIINAVTRLQPKNVLDLGCGEGWLVRVLTKMQIDTLGTDVVPELIETAKKQNLGRFQVLAYEQLAKHDFHEKFDLVVCNFSLLGKDSVEQVFQHGHRLLNQNGSLLVQSVHPVGSCGAGAYESAWRQGSWAGFSGEFSDPAPWYFRTIEDWQTLFLTNGFDQPQVDEPSDRKTGQPVSIIFSGRKKRKVMNSE